MQQWFIDVMVWLGLAGVPDPGLIEEGMPESGDADGIIIGNGRSLDGAAVTRESTGVAIAGVHVEHGRLVR